MSDDKAAESVEPAPPPAAPASTPAAAPAPAAPAEMNSIPNGKGHEPGEETTAAAKTPPGDTTEQ